MMHMAVRKQGVCRGSLWRKEVEVGGGSSTSSSSSKRGGGTGIGHAAPPSSLSSSSSSSSSYWSSTEVEYCSVTANWLICHESFSAFERGDAPMHMYRIVGASSFWSAAPTNESSQQRQQQQQQQQTSNNNKSFQLVTNQGTQLFCQAVTPKCREQWLAALQAGLQLTWFNECSKNTSESIMGNGTEVLQPPRPQVSLKEQQQQQQRSALLGGNKSVRYCCSCGSMETNTKPLIASSPVFQYGMEHRTEMRQECFVAQGLLDHLEFVKSCMASALQEHEALLQARELCVALVTPKQPSPSSLSQSKKSTTTSTTTTTETTSEPSLPSVSATTQSANSGNDTDNRDMDDSVEVVVDKEGNPQSCQETPLPPTTTESVSSSSENPQSPSSVTPAVAEAAPRATATTPSTTDDKGCDRSSDSSNGSNESWTKVDKPDESSTTTTPTTSVTTPVKSNKSGGGGGGGPSSWIHISPTSKSTTALLKALRDRKRFGAWMCASPFLEGLSEDLMEGRIGVTEFLEQLDDAVGQEETETALLKKQAFRVAGDMGTAMKLLLDYALPPDSTTNRQQQYHHHAAAQKAEHAPATTQHSTQMLQCLLEFFLDLCHDGELSSVAFFWPQLCHIHLCMLPPENALAVARVDLVEDFLITVASQYSIHLAMELVWSHTADLEESLNFSSSNASCTPACRARRFAVLRFVCELESYLFGHEDGWGGGSVTLGKMLSATSVQLRLLKKTITQIQDYRRRSVFGKLHRSVRHPNTSATTTSLLSSSSEPEQQEEQFPEEMIQEKLRIAKNADYFTSHLNFTKRVCDIAEKLRFTDIRCRDEALQDELRLLNASGAMGGDPLNRISDSMVRIVRVPAKEGHVFRSKERTPVLLLVEQVDEGAEYTEVDGAKKKWDAVIKEGRCETEEEQKEISKDEVQKAPPTEENDDNKAVTDTEKQQEEEDAAEKTTATSDDIAPEPPRPLTELEGTPQNHRPHTKALKRFDALSTSSHHRGSEEMPGSPSMHKEVVDQMVTNVMVEQFKHDFDIAVAAKEDIENPDDKSRKKQAEAPLSAPPSPNRTKASGPRRMFRNSSREISDRANELAPTGDIRREVLNFIMMRGRQERNSIAAGAAESVQRSLKELETKRATALLLGDYNERDGDGGNRSGVDKEYRELGSTKEKLASLGLDKTGKNLELDQLVSKPSEEDEVMEAVRLLLVQNRVAQGYLSPADAAKVLQHVSLSRVNSATDKDKKGMSHPSHTPTIDAGDLDPRLAGCGPLPPAVLQALTLWKGEMVTNGELLELVKKDIEFVRHSVLLEAETVDKLKEDSAFWGRFAFGERWAENKSRIAASSPQASHTGWDLVGIIVKSNDDLRQEAFVMQLIELCQEAFEIAGLELWVSPYRILATGRTTGIIEMVRNAMSFDALKKRPGYGKGGLREHLRRMTEFTADPGSSFKLAQQNFVRSLAAYSLMSYFFLFKDRHNGNLLLDTAGHVIHIDFGFVFGVAPGGSFSLEMSTPFKLTEEMLEVMGGPQSPLFSDFVTLFCCGFLALQSYSDTFVTLVEITSRNSTFKCFAEGQTRDEILAKMRERFCPELNTDETIAFALDLIQQSLTSYGTRQYDLFQYLSQGIAS